MSTDETKPERDKYGILTEKPTQEKWDDLKMRDQIGIFADVVRGKAEDEGARRANAALADIGDFIHGTNPIVKGLEYLGSAAVHIYLAPTLNQVVYISQTQPLGATEERIVGPAITDLQKSAQEYFGRRTTRIRSGF